jgi:hypothetical protein
MNHPENAGRYRLAFIDLDDTLLGPDKKIGPDNLHALDRLRGAGVEIAIASGRHHRNITALRQLDATGWILSSNGSVIRHEQTGEVLAETYLDGALALQLAAQAHALGLCAIAYHGDGAFLERPSEWTDLYEVQSGWTPQVTSFDSLDPTRFQKVIWAGHPNRIQELARSVQDEFSSRASVLVTNPELLEFFPQSVNKAVGAQTLARRLQVAPGATLAFGDGSNDVELLRWAGLSIAMHHGRPTAHDAARLVSAPGPAESAFARAVQQALQFAA